ncbi:alginate lyase family protein [Rhizobium wuzhouense]|uniref:Alginate lyase n=1 Tax=Rhizobium wuzhouense TaxID=1986026 RepID=A0ABX5NRI3_9HYPH|nr:alginate lyase family protein [Rhizobium wuzhouense]PYB73931.1 alginate lyase [Rhizobium wuzhouense]
MASLTSLAIAATLSLGLSLPAAASGWAGLFDVESRAATLKTDAYRDIRALCLAVAIDPAWTKLKPIRRLATTEGYGSDTSAEDFSWAVMVLSGRALAGDADARRRLSDLLDQWAAAGAFTETEEINDAYYALKRQLLPLSVAYAILEPGLETERSGRLRSWIDGLVRKIDHTFDGDVDHNNHRVLADSVLAVWGAETGDKAMMEKGLARYETVLDETRFDGTLALEARRGARALWYQRQTLSSLTVMAETARGHGWDFYSQTSPEGRSYATLLGALLNGISSPILVAVYAAENHIPGPEKDFRQLELGFLETRGHGRHYMGWAEAAMLSGHGLAFDRLKGLFARQIVARRPLIDEFIGGNSTCFWGQP